jgi:hypothetical protein
MTHETLPGMYPILAWRLVEQVSYAGMPIFQHPWKGDLGYDDGSCLRDLPGTVMQAIRTGTKGNLS